MDDFEQHLKTHPLRAVPTEWREHILSAATTSTLGSRYVVPPSGGPNSSGASPNTTPAPWWHRCLWPSPYAWGTLAFIWLIIFVLNAAAQPSRAEILARGPAPNPQEIMALLDEWRQLEDEFSRSPVTSSTSTPPAMPPPSKPQTSGAYLEKHQPNSAHLA